MRRAAACIDCPLLKLLPASCLSIRIVLYRSYTCTDCDVAGFRLVRMLYHCCLRRPMQLAYSREDAEDMLQFLNFHSPEKVDPALFTSPKQAERARV